MYTGLILIAWTLAGQPSEMASDELKSEVRRLVGGLDSDALAERNAAEEALIQKGPAVLELLPAVTDRMSAEATERLARVRQKLEQTAVESAAQASLITLRADKMPLSKILAALAEQSGNKIADYREKFGQPVNDPILKVQFDKTPFWQALDQVLDQAGLTVYSYANEPGVNIVGRAADRLPRVQTAVYSGPLRFEAMRLVADRDLDYPKASWLRLSLEAAWEPRLKPIILRQRLAEVSAVDERGQALAVESDEAEMEVPVDGLKSAVELTLPFALPPREAKQIAKLKGKLTAVIPGRIEAFRFDDLLKAKNVEKRRAGVSVTLEQVRQNNAAWEIFVRVRFDQPGDALASHRGWILRNEAYLEGPDGKPIDFDRMETTRQTKNEIGIAYIFVLDKPPSDMKFIYKTPGAILDANFTYEIRNLKLP